MNEIDRNQLILNLRSNPADPEIFEFFFCADCRHFVTTNGLFPPLARQPKHAGHRLAWLPNPDSHLPPHPPQGHILHWLENYRPNLSEERYRQLLAYATTTTSENWVWVVTDKEQADWLAYLNDYIEQLTDSWLAALDYKASGFFPEPAKIWRTNVVR